MELVMKIDLDDTVTEWGGQTASEILKDTIEHELRLFFQKEVKAAIEEHRTKLRAAAITRTIARITAEENRLITEGADVL